MFGALVPGTQVVTAQELIQVVNPVSRVGSPWAIKEAYAVTPSNQNQFAAGLWDTCGLASVAELHKKQVTTGVVQMDDYVPPIGWRVAVVSGPLGEDEIWIRPDGTGWSVGACQESQTTVGAKPAGGGLLILGGLALVLYYLFKKKR